MNDFQVVKIEIFIPEQYLEKLRKELNRANAGRIGNYDNCISVTEVRGYWRALEGANPYQGTVGEVGSGNECKVEVNCKREFVAAAIKAIKSVHPYEEPVINVIPLVNHLFTNEEEIL